ncbi:YciI family protein [Dactylosporangium sp. NPDC049140]|uniref:YciI family protein n=1 Tax=Dactylosporangium sp. NPDC049140 TaxID=3155647 RepID=UPI0033D0BBC6
MKYIILSYASQRDYDAMAGKAGESLWKPADFAAMGEFMATFTAELEASGELVETRALDAPVHTRRIGGATGLVTDGPYAETQEVLAGYWIVECDSFDRATQIALRFRECPAPPEVAATAYADVRPIVEHAADAGF